MTENEVINVLKELNENYFQPDNPNEFDDVNEAINTAIQALEEIQQYRAIGLTPEMVKEMIESEKLASHEAIFRGAELELYQEIGTVEEFKDLKEKNVAKKVISFEYQNGHINYGCPICKRKIISKIDGEWCAGSFQEHCDKCGQKLDWQ